MRTPIAALLLLFAGCAYDCVWKGNDSMKSNENNEVVTLHGKPNVLLGESVAMGDMAPDFKVVDRDFKPVKLSDYKGKVCLISAIRSLDTSVCSVQTKRFNSEIGNLPSNVVMMTISMDLPFAQKRFCESEKVERILVLSDNVWREFGRRYGLLIEDLGLLARSIFIVGGDGKIVYKQIVPEQSHEPDYDAALDVIRRATGAR